jgi:hypothetical protein
MDKEYLNSLFATTIPPQPIEISVNYSWILAQLLKECKRTPEGLINDEALIKAIMEIDRRERKK